MVGLLIYDTSDEMPLVQDIACICFSLAAVLVTYKTKPITETQPVIAISILLIPALLIVILSLVGVIHFLPVSFYYAITYCIAANYPGKQHILPRTELEWFYLISMLLLVTGLIYIVTNEKLLKAILGMTLSN